MKKNTRKVLGSIIALNVVASSTLLNAMPVITQASENEPTPTNVTSNAIPAPKAVPQSTNLVKNPTYSLTTDGKAFADSKIFKYHEGEITYPDKEYTDLGNSVFLEKRSDGFAAAISDSGRFNYWGSGLEQEIDVLKGHTYKLTYIVETSSSNAWFAKSNMNAVSQFGGALESNYEMGTNSGRSLTYTATETGKVKLRLGGYRSFADSGAAGYGYVRFYNVKVVDTDVQAPDAPKMTSVLDTDTDLIQGTAEANSTMIVKNSEGEIIGTSDVNEHGEYSVVIPAQTQAAYGKELFLINKDISGNESDAAAVTIGQGSVEKPKVEVVTNKSIAVLGTTFAEVPVEVVISPKAGGNSIARQTVSDKLGGYSAVLGETLNIGDVVKVRVLHNGVYSDYTKTIVEDVEKPTNPKVNSITSVDKVLSGTATYGNTVKAKLANGTILSAVVNSRDEFTMNITPQKAGNKIIVTQVKPSGLASDPVTVTVEDGELSILDIAEFTEFDTILNGTTEANASVELTIKDKSGKETVISGQANSEGKFSINVPQQEAGTTIKVFAKKNNMQKEITITVKDVTAPEAAVVNDVYTDSTEVTGTAEAGATVNIYNSSEVLLGTTKADAEGNYKATIKKQALHTELTVQVVDPTGNKSETTTVKVAPVPLPAPIFNEVTELSTVLEGTAEANADLTFTFTNPTGEIVTKNAKVDSTGNFKLFITPQVAYTKIGLVVKLGERTSKPVVNIVKDVVAPNAATVKEVSNIDTTINGEAEAGADAVAYVAGQEIGRAEVDKDGQYAIPTKAQAIGTVIDVVVIDKAGNTSTKVSTTVVKTTQFDLNYDEYQFGDMALTGTVGKGIDKVRLSVDGVIVNQAQLNKLTGKFTFGSAGKFIVTKDSKVELVAVDAKYAEKNRVLVELKDQTKDLIELDAADYMMGVETITGKFEAPTSKVRLLVNGEVKSQAQTNAATGTFTFSNISKFITSKEDKVEVVAVNSQFTEVFRVGLPVKEQEGLVTLDQAEYTLGTTQVTGEFVAPVSRVRLAVNGVIKAQATTDSETGKFVFNNVEKYITSADDKVEIVAINSQFTEIYRSELPVKGEVVEQKLVTLDQAEYTLGGTELTGSFIAPVSRVRLTVNGVAIAQATTDSETGKFVFNNVEKYITSADDKVEVVAVNAQFIEVYRSELPVKGQVVVPKLVTLDKADYTVGTKQITGEFIAPASRVRLSVNGEVKAQASTDSETGKFVFNNVEKYIASADDKVEVVAVNAQFIEVYRMDLAVKGAAVTLDKANYKIGATELTGSFEDSVSKVRLVVNGVAQAQAVTDDVNGTFMFKTPEKYITSTTDKVEIVAVNAQYIEVYRADLALIK